MGKEKQTQKPNKLRRSVLIVFFLLCTVSSIGVTIWLLRDEIRIPILQQKSNRFQPQPEQYEVLKKALLEHKSSLTKRYKAARTAEQKQTIINESRTLLESTTPKMMRCWLGTGWDFHGTCETPGSGKIACGYFVSTIMRDAGFTLPRIKLSQQASQTILRAFVPRSEMTIRTGMNYQEFHDMVLASPPGIYIIGLDKHVGFIVHDGNQLRFIHSSGGAPKCVVDEAKDDATAIIDSHYRVIGNVTTQDETIKKWLLNEQVYP